MICFTIMWQFFTSQGNSEDQLGFPKEDVEEWRNVKTGDTLKLYHVCLTEKI